MSWETISAFAAAMAGAPLASGLLLPLFRLLGVMALGLIVAQALESFGWTAAMGRLAAPLIRFARLSPLSGASFALSFASPSAANALLAEGRAGGKISGKELALANVINSTPAFLVHLPSLLATAFSFLGGYALAYVGLTFAAALARTWGAALAGHLLFAAPPPSGPSACPPPRDNGTWQRMLARFRKRLAKICRFTIPVYCLMFFLQQAGLFARAEELLAAHAGVLTFLHPASLGVVVLFVAAESNAAFAAAAALLHGGALLPEQAVLALLAGNILSSPMRAFRHQLPSYAGFFSPGTALFLVSLNQSLRAATLILAAAAYAAFVV